MGAPLLLADNLLNALEYPLHTALDQSGTIGPVGFEVWRVADGRRSVFDYWQPGIVNLEAFFTLTCNRVRAANCLILDRGHNLAGKIVKLQGSQTSAFSSFRNVVNATVPVAGGSITDPNGVTTEEGAWLISFPADAYTYWRLDIPAMGTGLQPTIVGCWLGMAYQPVALYRPYPDHPTTLSAQEIMTAFGWRGRGPRGFGRSGTLNVRMNDMTDEYELARFTLEELYGAGKPMWVVQDTDLATQAFLAIRPLGTQGFERPPTWAMSVGAFQFVEHEPLPVS